MIKAWFSLLLISSLHLQAQTYEIQAFESDVFSKKGNSLKQITLSLWLDGQNLDSYGIQIKDALNIVVSSFYLEDLLTSKGKESFKDSFTQYVDKKYHIKLDNVYINSLKRSKNPLDVDELIEALKAAGYLYKNKTVKKVFDTIDE